MELDLITWDETVPFRIKRFDVKNMVENMRKYRGLMRAYKDADFGVDKGNFRMSDVKKTKKSRNQK